MREIEGIAKDKCGRQQYKTKCTICGLIAHVRVSRYDKDAPCKHCSTVERNKQGLGRGAENRQITKTFFNYFKNGAKRRKVEFKVSITYVNSLWTGKCAISGLSIEAPRTTDGNGNFSREGITASLDRINSSLGYVEGNVQWVHKYINIMKNGFSQEEFIYLCQTVAQNHANQQPSVLKGNRKVSTKVQRLESEEIPANNLSTSAQHPTNEGDDIVRHSDENQRNLE